LRRARTVREDWVSWLPAEKDGLFGTTVEQLESLYSMLSISLNEALSLRAGDTLRHARDQAGISADLFDRLADQLLAILRTLEEHGRHFGTVPNITPPTPAFFRGEIAQRTARKSALLCKVLFPARSKFFHKLRALGEIVEDLKGEFRETAEEIAEGASARPSADWEALDVLHYDLNTCLLETIVVLKSFICALANDQVQPLRQRLLQASVPLCSRKAHAFRGSS
jgi:hypothetical protein